MHWVRVTLNKHLRSITDSIAFFPTLIAVGIAAFALLVIWLEYQPWMSRLKRFLDVVMVESVEDGRLILGTLVASIISLMVFSFSMVMVVLNQASANLSPRLLPGLITVKDNQVVLGFYLGTICFCLMLILNINPQAAEARVPSLGIFIGLVLGLGCLGLFTYFIHSISQAIQVDHILDRLLRQTLARLDKSPCKPLPELPSTDAWPTLTTPKAGYLKWIQQGELLQLCQRHDVQLQMLEPIGHFYVANSAFLRSNRTLDKTLQHDIRRCFVFYPQERLGDHYSFGFKQIAEIAIKALSPGMNDPATAIKAIDMLVMLFIERCMQGERCELKSLDGETRMVLKPTLIDDLLQQNISQIREYAKHDPLVMLHLLNGLSKIWRAQTEPPVQRALQQHMVAVRDSCAEALTNNLDRQMINAEIRRINNAPQGPAIAPL